MSADSIDITNHQSTGRFREFMAGLIDGGEVPIEGFLDVSDTNGQIKMVTDFGNGATKTAIVTGPNSILTWTLSAFITKLKIGDHPIDGAIPYSATVKITGAPVLAIATSAGLTTPFFAISESAVVAPAASGSVYDYVATVLTAVTSVTVTPTASAGVITVNGNTVASGEASSAITLGAAGSITTITVVVTETNKAPKTYTIRVVRSAS
jgi:predicted secreted protein